MNDEAFNEDSHNDRKCQAIVKREQEQNLITPDDIKCSKADTIAPSFFLVDMSNNTQVSNIM